MVFLKMWFPAAENLVPYSEKEPGIFKANKLEPVKDLKLLIKDYAVLFPLFFFNACSTNQLMAYSR